MDKCVIINYILVKTFNHRNIKLYVGNQGFLIYHLVVTFCEEHKEQTVIRSIYTLHTKE